MVDGLCLVLPVSASSLRRGGVRFRSPSPSRSELVVARRCVEPDELELDVLDRTCVDAAVPLLAPGSGVNGLRDSPVRCAAAPLVVSATGWSALVGAWLTGRPPGCRRCTGARDRRTRRRGWSRRRRAPRRRARRAAPTPTRATTGSRRRSSRSALTEFRKLVHGVTLAIAGGPPSVAPASRPPCAAPAGEDAGSRRRSGPGWRAARRRVAVIVPVSGRWTRGRARRCLRQRRELDALDRQQATAHLQPAGGGALVKRVELRGRGVRGRRSSPLKMNVKGICGEGRSGSRGSCRHGRGGRAERCEPRAARW